MTTRLLTCAVCPNQFEAKRPNAKYCSPACRVRAHRSPGGSASAQPRPARGRAGRPKVSARMAATTRAQLAAARKLDTPWGQAAMLLAKRLDAGSGETLAAVAAAVREHAQALDRALQGDKPDDPVQGLRDRYAGKDEVAERRAAKKG